MSLYAREGPRWHQVERTGSTGLDAACGETLDGTRADVTDDPSQVNVGRLCWACANAVEPVEGCE